MDVKEYVGNIQHLTNAGYTTLLMALGHELGLFNVMMKENRPLSSQELADIANMKERYVREWLSGMAVAKVIMYDNSSEKFFIDEQCHGQLRQATAWVAGINVFSARTEDLKKCYTKDGPFALPDSHADAHMKWFSRYRAITSKDIAATVLSWLEKTPVANKLNLGVNILDAGCGSGEITAEFVRTFPNSTFTALDVNENVLAITKQRMSPTGISNNKTLLGDIHNLPEEMSEQYDVVLMFECLHDLPDPYKAISEVHRALKPDGFFVVMEIRPSSQLDQHIGSLQVAALYSASAFSCLPASLSAEPRTGGGTCWGRKNIEAALKEKFHINELFETSDISDLYVCTKKI